MRRAGGFQHDVRHNARPVCCRDRLPQLLAQGSAGLAVKAFFLACIVIAGLYGAATASRKILYVQAIPGAVALVLVLMT